MIELVGEINRPTGRDLSNEQLLVVAARFAERPALVEVHSARSAAADLPAALP